MMRRAWSDLAQRSLLVRSLAIGALAIAVMVGGVMAGALVVAPVVASATSPAASGNWDRISAKASTLAGNAMTEATALVRDAGAALPANTPTVALPILAMVSIVAALTILFARRRTPARSLVPDGLGSTAAPRTKRNTKPNGRAIGRNARTPKAVEALAASGASTSDIARRTGLPIDAVQLLLAISSGARQLQPPAA